MLIWIVAILWIAIGAFLQSQTAMRPGGRVLVVFVWPFIMVFALIANTFAAWRQTFR